MSQDTFVHLHVHTEFSLLDGLSRIKKLVSQAKELNMPALAITDHGTMFGVMDFYNACRDADIKPIIGVEAYLSPRGMEDRDPQLDKSPFHILLIAQNEIGYRNLLKISSEGQLRGYYYRPRVDWDFLQAHSEGVIATSGCLAARIPRAITDGRDDEARDLIGQFVDLFGPDRFYLELQEHEIDIQRDLNRWLIDYNRTNHTNVGLLATTDLHYVREQDFDTHDTLLCVQTGSIKSSDNRMKFSDNSYWMYPAQKMRDIFHEVPEAVDNSVKIAEMCDVNLDRQGYHLPVFPVPEGFDEASYLRHLCELGMDWRFGSRKDDPVLRKRLDRELSIIHDMGFDTYFLIVWDLCEFARHADIWWNVRGSGAGSLAAYCLGITNIDPIQNNLLFERFLNPGRVSMPDIDLDYPDDRRGEMIAYTARKYGEDKVAAIITFGTMGAKAAVRDIGRVMDVPLEDVNRAAALIPQEAKQKPLMTYVETIPDLKKLYDSDRHIRRVIDAAKELQGISRHASTHAAGVIVADKPLVEYLPLHRITGKDPSDGALKGVTQFPMETCESIGLLKVDFLGLSTLTILRKACDLIEQYHGVKYTMDNIPYRHDDERLTDQDRADLDEAFRLLSRGDTAGVFQVESTGMQQMLREMKPRVFENIIAGISLYRPGPMEFIPAYNRRLHGEEEPQYLHPKLKDILEETYSIIVYQEQIMQIAGQLFGYDLGEADLMRRAVSKKKEKDLKKHKAIFMERGPENGIDAEIAEQIFDEIEFFANYGFNKCLVGSTEIIDADSGHLVRLDDLFSGKAKIKHTLSLDTDTLQLKPSRVTEVMANGIKPVYRLTTQLGRQIDATANHPFYTFDGWTNLEDLTPGTRIATPRQLPIKQTQSWEKHKIIVLGHLLAEGNLCHPTGVYYYTGDEEQWQDYVTHLEQFANTVASTHQRRGMYDVYGKRINRQQPTEVVEWIESLGLRNANSHTKFIPDEVFELTNDQIALLISRMWEGDGHINLVGRSIYYATSSKRMVWQLQHLLLRFGIISRVRTVNFPYKDGRDGYQLFITGNQNLSKFNHFIGIYFISETRRHMLDELVLTNPQSTGVKDIVPVEIKHVIRQEKVKSGKKWAEISSETGLSTTTLSRKANGTKSGYTRQTVGQFASYFASEELQTYAQSDIYWDTITSIEYIGEEPTYDLSVEDTHNFIANDIIVHNSHASDYAVITVQTAFLKAHYPEEYLTALLSVHYDDSAKVSHFLEECRRLAIPILPPDVNYSMLDFAIQEDPETGRRGIRFGLAAIKNAGANALKPIIDEREANGQFTDLLDLCQRVDLRNVGKRTMESLIKVGALRDFGSRAQLLDALERIVGYSATHHRDKEIGQMNMFGGDAKAGGETFADLGRTEEVPNREMLNWEKELLGLYVTGRPVDKFRAELEKSNTRIVQELKSAPEQYHKVPVSIAGEIVSLRRIYTKKGDAMCVIQLEDWHDSAATIDVVLFPSTWNHVDELLESGELTRFEEGTIIRIEGEFDASRGDTQVIAKKVSQNLAVQFAAAEEQHLTTSEEPAWLNYDEDISPPPGFEPPPPDYGAKSYNGDYGQNGDNGNGQNGHHKNHHDDDSPPPWINAADDNGHDVANGHDAGWDSFDDTFKPAIPRKRLTILFQREGDEERDVRRLRHIYNILHQNPGADHFAIKIQWGNRWQIIEYPESTTELSENLLQELIELVGSEDNILLEDL